jgi:hypothetical protein
MKYKNIIKLRLPEIQLLVVVPTQLKSSIVKDHDEPTILLKMAVFWVVAPCSLVNIYQTTRCYNPEYSHLHTHRRENLKSYYNSFV